MTEYRQIGYEKRQLRDEDFNNDMLMPVISARVNTRHAILELTLNAKQESPVDKLRYAQDKATKSQQKSL